MKSVTEMLRFLHQCLSSRRDERRLGPQKMKGLGYAEAVEARLLLTADLQDVLFDATVINEIPESTSVDSYFVAFESAQDPAELLQATNAASVVSSELVANGYNLSFDTGMTLQEAADSLSGLEGFVYLYPNFEQVYAKYAAPNDALYADQWHLRNTGQGGGVVGIDANIETAWDNYTGEGVVIAIVDDGMEVTHEDLAPNARTDIDYDFNDNDNDPSPVATSDNHGTSVAGVAGAAGNSGIGVAGGSWDAELVGLRLIAGGITDQTIASALTHELQTIDIYNNSWGPGDITRINSVGPQTFAALETAATQGRSGLGSILVYAAGNSSLGSNVNYNAYTKSRHTIAVGALGNNGVRADYSTPGAAVVVVAPSNGGTLGITTTDRTGAVGYSTTNYANDFGGTSSAAPLVSGIIGLMLEANPLLSYRDVTSILVHTSNQVNPSDPSWAQNGAGLWVSHEYGFGNIDATAAVNAAVTHVNLPDELEVSTGLQQVNQAIPDSGNGAVTQTVTVNKEDALSLEYVELVLNADHQRIGDLEVVLTSPSGTRSVLAESRTTDPGTSYSNYSLTTVHNWDESSDGVWTVTLTDKVTGSTGTFNSFELNFYGVQIAPIISESGGNTIVTDSGSTDFFDVVLPSMPSSDVVLNVVSQDTNEVTTSTASLTFTPSNWDTPQRVTVSGVADLVQDGDKQTDVIISVDTANSDALYANVGAQTVSVTSRDDDFNLPLKPVITSPGARPATSSPAFEWTSVDNAVTYNITITNEFTGAVVQQRSGLILPRHTFASPFVNSIYRAVVRGVNADGVVGLPSDPLLFSIGEPAVPAAPVITSPTQGSIITNNLPQIQWRHSAAAVEYELFLSAGGNVTRVRVPGVDIGNGLRAYTPTTSLPEGFNSVWVRAFNPFGDPGDWSTPVGFTVDAFQTPSTPTMTAPILTVTTNASPTFRWIGAGATSYELWVDELPGGDSSVIAPTRVIYVTDLAANEYTHFNPLNNAKHRAWVRGVNDAGEKSEWSPHIEFTVDVPTPQLPQLVEIGRTEDQTPTFTWNSASGDAFGNGTRFTLWVNNLTTGEARAIHETGIVGTSYTPTTPLPQGRYAAWVQAVSAVGIKSAWSPRIVLTVDQPAPERPTLTGPAAEASTGTTDILTDLPEFEWTATVGSATYELWVNHLDSGTVRIVHEKGIEDTTFTPELRLPEGTFKAWVRGYNLAGEVGEWSEAYTFNLDVPTPGIPTITGPATNAVGTVVDPTPTITWDMAIPTGNYDLQLEHAGTGNLVIDETGITTESYTVPIQLSETTYRTRVRAVNSAGEQSEWTEWSTFRIDVPNATTPIALGPTGTVLQNNVTFQWQHTSGNVQYEILVRDLLKQESITFRDFTFQVDPDQSRATINRSLPNGTYRFWVRAFNSQGTASAWSNSLSFTVENRLTSLRSEVADDDDTSTVAVELKFQPDEAYRNDDAKPADSAEAPVAEAGPESTGDVAKRDSNSDDIADSAMEAVMAELADPANADLLYPAT